MIWQWTPYSMILLLTALVSITVAYMGWRRRPAPGVRPFVTFMAGLALWALGDALIWTSANLENQIFWNHISYLGIVLVPGAWFVFSLEYTGLQEWVTRGRVGLLCVEPVIILLLAWTNDAHHLLWARRWAEDLVVFSVFRVEHGLAFWIHTGYSYLLLAVAAFIIAGRIVRAPGVYRGQAGALLVGAFAPWLVNLIYVFQINPFHDFDMTPLAFMVTGLVVSWAFLRLHLLDVVPVARDAIFEIMIDAVLVLDSQDRVVDFNPAAWRLFHISKSTAVGERIERVLAGYPALLDRLKGAAADGSEIRMGEPERFFDVLVSPFHNLQGGLPGRLVTLRDITERKKAEAALREAHDRLEDRVQVRTAELLEVNEALYAEVAERKRVEEALRESEERYRLHFDYISDVIYSISPDFKLLTISPSIERHLGYRPEEFVGRPLDSLDLISPEHLAMALQDMLHVLSGAVIASRTYEFIARDGTRKTGEVSGSPLYRNGEIIAVVSVARDITERMRAEEKLKASLEEKEILLKEIHHRVKNNLQVVTSLLYLQSRQIEDEETLDLLKESQNRVRSMAFVHEKLYQSEDLARIDFVEYARYLGGYLLESYRGVGGNVRFTVEGSGVFLNIDTAMSCALILNELISNALKHAFQDRREGEIKAIFQIEDLDGSRRFSLTVVDNGAGLPEGLGFDNTQSLGLQLVNTLARQLEGSVTVRSGSDGGTRFTISFEMQEPFSDMSGKHIALHNK